MIKIKKISLQNFKGIKSKSIFHFDNEDTNVNILSGPNGFGKTTIFDVLEICLTGSFKRTEFFDNVQKKTANRNKPFFQNTDNEDVILRLWLYNTTTETNYIIIKHYDDDVAPKRIKYGRDFIPTDAEHLFITYLTTETTNFETDNFTNLTRSTQEQINALFFGSDSVIDLNSTYYLFNYIQQEDSIYFLRKNEDDKGASLGFLFNIEREEAEKQKILQLQKYLSDQSKIILQQIAHIQESLPHGDKGEYQKLFPDKNFEFDKEYPFLQTTLAADQLQTYKDIINSLVQLKNNFVPDEYEKSLKFKKLNDEVLDNRSVLNAILIKKVYTEDLHTNRAAVNAKIAAANNFLLTSNTSFIPKEYFDYFLPAASEFATYSVIENSIREIDKDLGSIGRIISELNSSRKLTLDKFNQVKHKHGSDKNCPLCDNAFESFDSLLTATESKTLTWESFNAEKLQQKARLEEQIVFFHARILESATTYIKSNSTIEPAVLALLREYPLLKEKIEALFTTYPMLSSAPMEAINFTQPPETISDVTQKVTLLREFLINNILSQLSYNQQSIEGKQLYTQYFDADRSKFNSISVDMLLAKLQYVQGAYTQIANSRLTFLQARSQKLENLQDRVDEIYDTVHKTIQNHKAEMIEKIKVPFYIYSGKILQSYQQGLGIFVQIRSTDQSNNVLFKTGHSSDHDIVYHLSSGQMAVVSLAFCLSLNKVYNTNKRFKFLSIDDPIQTMDDLNIHTFVELIRNEFKEYQIIMSTHDDFTSRYMKYKFDKFSMNTEIQNVQKIVLEQSLN